MVEKTSSFHITIEVGLLWLSTSMEVSSALFNGPMSVWCKEPILWRGAAGAGQASGASVEADGETEEDEGPKAELKLGEESTLLFKEPAKLYFKGKDGVSLISSSDPCLQAWSIGRCHGYCKACAGVSHLHERSLRRCSGEHAAA